VCSFVVKLTLSQISLILPEFTHFIFITINTHLSIRTQQLSQNTQILSKSTLIPWWDLSVTPKEEWGLAISLSQYPRGMERPKGTNDYVKLKKLKTLYAISCNQREVM
jgi:hypothetical protein